MNAVAKKPHQHNKYQFVAFDAPTKFSDAYNDKDREKLLRIIQWMNDNKKQKSWLAAATRLNNTTFHIVMGGEYVSSPTRFLDTALSTIATMNERKDIKEIDFVETQTWLLTVAVCKRARKYKDFGVLTGAVGTGKTRSLKQYVAENPNTMLVEAVPRMSQLALLNELVKLANIPMPKMKDGCNRETKLGLFIERMKNTNSLIIIDEAETVTADCLHMLRRIRDLASIGIVLAGTEKLHLLVSPVGGQFDQIRSRVGMWPKPIRSIPREDADAIVALAFNDQPDTSVAVYDRLWHYCKGSMRMLAENLIPTIRDYGLKQGHALTVELIDKIAVDVLSLPKFDATIAGKARNQEKAA